MSCRICLRLGILLLLGTLCCSRLASAQSQGCVESAPVPRDPALETKITIMSAEFDAESPLSEALRVQAAKTIQQQEFWNTPDEGDSDWVNQAIQPIRDALRDQGYFKASVEATPYLVRALPTEKHYVLAVKTETGPKYYLGKLRFANADPDGPSLVFADDLLRQQMPLKEGEVFDVSKIREGLDAIGRLYGSRGYIDATPEPDTTIDEKDSRIDLLIKLDQQPRYKIRKMGFLGLDPNTQNQLKLPQEIGEPFNSLLWKNFFEENKAYLPVNASPEKNLQIMRNNKDAIVDIVLDFRSCPKASPFDN
jgi:outer membrane protein assembly factor BamA